MFENLEIGKWLELNAKLQQKKNALRKELKSRGILQKDKTNDYDHYNYFSEAQYKKLFTELFSDNGLELKFYEENYGIFETNSEKQPNGRLPRIIFTLFDIETGFGEETAITGEAVDKGDKAGYKAYTGALKYYLADTFMVATGDDPENESPEGKMKNNTRSSYGKQNYRDNNENMKSITNAQIARIMELNVNLPNVYKRFNVKDLTQLTYEQAEIVIRKKEESLSANSEG